MLNGIHTSGYLIDITTFYIRLLLSGLAFPLVAFRSLFIAAHFARRCFYRFQKKCRRSAITFISYYIGFLPSSVDEAEHAALQSHAAFRRLPD